MKNIFYKFFRKDLDLNSKRRHRLLKVVRFLIFILAIACSFGANEPSYRKFIGNINYEGTIIDRLPSSGFFQVGDLLADNEYFFISKNRGYYNLGENSTYTKEDISLLEEGYDRARNTLIFCSSNWKPDYIKEIKKTHNPIKSYDGSVELFTIDAIVNRIESPCLGITTDNILYINNSNNAINVGDDFLSVGGYIYTIDYPNKLKIYINRILNSLLYIALYVIITLVLYYQGIIYIIYGSKKR